MLDIRETPSRCTTRGRQCYRAVATRLAEMEELAWRQSDETTRSALLRSVHGWQFLLAQHRSVGRRRSRCRLCRSRWDRVALAGSGAEWPCPTWWIAYAQLCLLADSTPELPCWPGSPPPGRHGTSAAGRHSAPGALARTSARSGRVVA